MSMPAEWVKHRLPPDASFNKLGETRTVDQAIADALADNGGKKELALADLLEELAARQKFDSETLDEYSYSGPRLQKMAEYWRSRGDEDGVPPGTFTFVPARFRSRPTGDEYSR